MSLKSYDKLSYRISSIISKLAYDERPSLEELSDEFSVSLRTLQRDIYLRMNTLPIVKDESGRLRFNSGFSLKNSVLSYEETKILLRAFELIELKGESDKFDIEKLKKKLLFSK